jgi:hypothetical protein
MKRLIIHLVVGLVTFLMGVAITNSTANRHFTFTPKLREVETAALKVSEPSGQFSITVPAPNLICEVLSG